MSVSDWDFGCSWFSGCGYNEYHKAIDNFKKADYDYHDSYRDAQKNSKLGTWYNVYYDVFGYNYYY